MRLSKTLVLILGLYACQSPAPSKSYQVIGAKTMGTSYTIKADMPASFPLQTVADSILRAINLSVSTYIPNSVISILNTDSMAVTGYTDGPDSILVYRLPVDPHFMKNFSISKKYHNDSHGYFDPTVMPLVNYWGFGTTEKKAVKEADSMKVRSLMERVGFKKWILTADSINMTLRKPAGSQLDFSAVAKGYAVDYLAEHLESEGAENYMVEIGGEVRTKGMNPDGKNWSIGLSRPMPEASQLDFQAVITVENMALASSGNYRNYYKVGERYYGHEINPNTGYPEMNDLLGVSVLARECAAADAMATAFMVMGLERSRNWLSRQTELKAVLFYQDPNGEIIYAADEGIHMVQETPAE